MEKISLKELHFSGPIEFLTIRELSIEVQVNAHAALSLKGMIPAESYGEIRRERLLGKAFRLYYRRDGEENSLFAGILTGAEIVREDGVTQISLTGSSPSIQFDREKRNRFLQNRTLTYGELLGEIAGEGRAILAITGNRQLLRHPLLQYQETDWEFILRLAGHFQTVIVPEALRGYPQIAFGLPRGKRFELDGVDQYTLIRSYGQYHSSESAKSGHRERDSYKVSCSENMELGDKVKFQNFNLSVLKKRVILQGGLLEMEYELGDEETYGLSFSRNQEIQGLDLEGEVLWADGEEIKIRVNAEREQDADSLFSYPYLPETGNLLYCMPEKGAKVFLHFPHADERECFLVNCIRDERTAYPGARVKVLQAANGKLMLMTPGLIAFQASRRKRGSTVRLEDNDGIGFSTVRGMNITAKRDIKIVAGLSCMITSDTLVAAEQSGTENRIEISGSCIKMSAEQYLCSTPMQKGIRTASPPAVDYEACAKLYGFVAGAIPSDVESEKDVLALAAIPVVCKAVGPVSIAGYIGWRSGRGR